MIPPRLLQYQSYCHAILVHFLHISKSEKQLPTFRENFVAGRGVDPGFLPRLCATNIATIMFF
jgi:hypothetical protein